MRLAAPPRPRLGPLLLAQAVQHFAAMVVRLLAAVPIGRLVRPVPEEAVAKHKKENTKTKGV